MSFLLFMSAHCADDFYEGPQYCVFKVNDDTLQDLQFNADALRELKSDCRDLRCANLYSDAWWITGTEAIDRLMADGDHHMVSAKHFTDDDLDSLEAHRMDLRAMLLYPDGDFYFEACLKYSGIEFSTTLCTIKQIEKLLANQKHSS